MISVAASLLAANYLNISSEIDRVALAGADYLHFDVMDGAFVPQITFGTGLLRLASAKSLPIDVHLMVNNPERHIDMFAEAGAKIITIHAEATPHANRLLNQIHEAGCLCGIALNPATSLDCLRYVLNIVDIVLIMTVNPGWGGQKIIPSAIKKVADLRKMINDAGSSAVIEVDGGVNSTTAKELVENGASMLVTGSALFKASDPSAYISGIKALDM